MTHAASGGASAEAGADDGSTAANWVSEEWSATILDPRMSADAEVLARLRADDRVIVLDSIEGQHAEIADLLPPATSHVLDEPTRWAWYPWRRTLVHILGPTAFRLVRLDRNRNKITRQEQERLGQLRIGIVGLSVGHAIAHTLALQGVAGVLRLADFDAIEISNLNRIPASLFDLGVNKAVVVGRRIAELDPYLTVEVNTAGLTEETMPSFMAGLDLVIEECDSLDMKVRLREAAKEAGIALIMETSDRGLLDVERFDLEPDRPVFHGLLGDTTAADLRGLSTHDKVPHVLRILEPDQLSARMAASMAEVDVSVHTWPQLGGDIMLGAASVAATVTRIGRGSPLGSGRTRIDLEAQLDALVDLAAVPTPASVDGVASTDNNADDGAWLVPPDDPMGAIVHAATLAPSGGNTQPWRISTDQSELRIAVDPSRTSRMDVQFRGSYVAVGAALFNARVTAASVGMVGETRLQPGEDGRTEVRLGLRAGSDPALAALAPHVLTRSTNRRFGDGTPIDDATIAALRAAAEAEGARLAVIHGPDALAEAADLMAESDRVRFLTPELHAEMMSELRWPGVDGLSRGLDVRTLELDESDLAKLQVARRADVMRLLDEWGAGRALGDVSRDRIASSGTLVVVTASGTTDEDYVRGGQAVERMWLEAQRLGVAVHPMSPVFLYALDEDDFEHLSSSHSAHLRMLCAQFRTLMNVAASDSCLLAVRLSVVEPPTFRSRREPSGDGGIVVV